MGAADGGRVLVPGPVVPTLGDLVPKDTRQRLEAVLLVAAGWRGGCYGCPAGGGQGGC